MAAWPVSVGISRQLSHCACPCSEALELASQDNGKVICSFHDFDSFWEFYKTFDFEPDNGNGVRDLPNFRSFLDNYKSMEEGGDAVYKLKDFGSFLDFYRSFEVQGGVLGLRSSMSPRRGVVPQGCGPSEEPPSPAECSNPRASPKPDAAWDLPRVDVARGSDPMRASVFRPMNMWKHFFRLGPSWLYSLTALFAPTANRAQVRHEPRH